MAWSTPKTDWLSTNKYNYTDFVKLIDSIAYVATIITGYGITLSQEAFTIWGYGDDSLIDIRLDQLTRNINDVGDKWLKPLGWIEITDNWESNRKPNLENLSYIDINTLETDIKILKEHEELFSDAVLRTGEPLAVCAADKTTIF